MKIIGITNLLIDNSMPWLIYKGNLNIIIMTIFTSKRCFRWNLLVEKNYNFISTNKIIFFFYDHEKYLSLF